MFATEPGTEELSARELVTSRIIDAPPEAVFAAFVDPDRLARWWGPKGFRNTFDECDPRPGGRWLYVMHGPDGGHFRNESLFAEVVRPERIVIWHLSAPRFVLITTFADGDGRTRLTWRQRFETAADCERIRALAVPANEQNLDRLASEVLGR